MSNKKKFNYQQLAVENAIEFLKKKNEFNLQSPTGSGKTFIIADIIDKYLENDILNDKPTTFLFIAPSMGKLDYQGYEKITNYLKEQWVKGFSTNYIGVKEKKTNANYLENIDRFKENNVYFLGWSLFAKNTKIMNTESEKNDLYRVIDNTESKGTKIVLIIDEAHREVKINNIAEMKKDIMKALKPIKTIKISATLDVKPDYKVSIKEVIDECSIKKMVEIQGESSLINFDKYVGEVERLILSGIEQQKKIKEEYHKENIQIKPLMTIQIPNKILIDKAINTEDNLLKKIELLLNEKGYKKDFNYAIWLDGNKTKLSKKEIVANDSPIEILIFKQAIAIGWDIPRANMLVRIREAKKEIFNIQTLGRILRNPFFRFYDNKYIDNAFVFTKDENYKNFIKQEMFYADNDEVLNLERSKKSLNKDIRLNKILIHDEKILIDEMVKIIADKIVIKKDFVKYLKFEHEILKDAKFEYQSEDILQDDQEKIQDKMNSDRYFSQELNFNGNPNITLFDLFIKYKTVLSNGYFINLIMEKISENIKNVKIKDFYWATYYNFNKSIFSLGSQNYSIKEIIDIEIDEYKKNHSKTTAEEYILPLRYETSTKYFDNDKWDNYNTFDGYLLINENIFSLNEREFCKEIKISLRYTNDEWHLFRNGVGKQDFFINYFNRNLKVLRFFPDFILINETTKKIIIFEIKGRNAKDIDKETNNKMNQLYGNIDKIHNEKSYKIEGCYKSFFNENENEMEYINEVNEPVTLEKILKIGNK